MLFTSSLFLLLSSLQVAHAIELATGGNLSNCKGGCPSGEVCKGNKWSQTVTDKECAMCETDQDYWPCNFETLCFCSSAGEGALHIPPAPRTGQRVNPHIDACRDILTEDVFNELVQPPTDEGKALFTYSGFCDAISQYNAYHDEKFASMGGEEMIRSELAAFLANTAIDTHGYTVIRDPLHCVDPITGSDGKVYCKPCKPEDYNWRTKRCRKSYFATEASYKDYCNSNMKSPQACPCDTGTIKPVIVPDTDDAVDTSGYIEASSAFFSRGALQISWNRDYYGASVALTGDASIFCENPELISTRPHYVWGVGIYTWMEKMIWGNWGTTAHRQVLESNFGGTVELLHGNYECPSNQFISEQHVEMGKQRVAEMCRTGTVLGVYLEMDKCDTLGSLNCLSCEGLTDIFETCQEDGTCPYCGNWTQNLRTMNPTSAPTTSPPSSSPTSLPPTNVPSLVPSKWVEAGPPSDGEWWNQEGTSESSAHAYAPSLPAILSLCFVLFSAGSLFA